MPRSMQNLSRGPRMFNGWPMVVLQCIHTITIIMTSDYRSLQGYGWSEKLSRMCNNHPDSLYGCCTEHVTFFHILNHGECFEHFKTVCTLQGACRTLQKDAKCNYDSCRLPQITTGIFTTFISVDNRDHKSAQCDQVFIKTV